MSADEGRSRGAKELTELNDNLAEVIRMSAQRKEAYIAHSTLVLIPLLEKILLHIAHALHRQADRIQDDSHNVHAGSKGMLAILRHLRAINQRHRQTRGPAPHHLEHEEAQKREELVARAIEAVVFPGLQDPEEQEAGEARGPDHEEEGDEDLARIDGVVVRGEAEGDEGNNDEVCAAGKVGELVEFECEGEREGDELVPDCDEEGDGEVVVVKDLHAGHDG